MKYCVKNRAGITFSCHKTKRAARKALLRSKRKHRMSLRVVKSSARERKRIHHARRAGTW